jgi:hypothetical protein
MDVWAWVSANRYGGRTEHSYGSTSHENAYGGSTTHVAGEGTEHTNAAGGTTEGRYGEGAYHSGPEGTAYHPPGAAAYPAYRPPGAPPYGAYPAYHPPTYVAPVPVPVAVPAYSSGCSGCAAAAGAVVGMAAGAAIASSNNAAATSNAYQAGVAAGSANTAAAYQAGVAAGGGSPYGMGANVASLPPGSMAVNKSGGTYYLNGNTWFKPSYGANGVYYTVVPAP